MGMGGVVANPNTHRKFEVAMLVPLQLS
jgi:hypothetical protein